MFQRRPRRSTSSYKVLAPDALITARRGMRSIRPSSCSSWNALPNALLLPKFPPGTTIQVKFRLPGGLDDIDAVGRVAWSDRKVGMGVQFDRISVEDQDEVDKFVDGHR